MFFALVFIIEYNVVESDRRPKKENLKNEYHLFGHFKQFTRRV